MNEIEIEYGQTLIAQEKVLSELSEKQVLLRKSVVEKNWEDLLDVMSDINHLSETFQALDAKRDCLTEKMDTKNIQKYYDQLFKLRRMLLKCKIENKALGEYVTISRQFMDTVIEKAVPTAGTKTYSRNGTIRKPQPQSVIVNQMF